MKGKLITILILITIGLTVSMCVSAEETEDETGRFEIRNGIYLGDDFETVLEKNDLGFETENPEEYAEDEDNGTYTIFSKEAKIAGIEDSQLSFIFRDRKLEEVIYNFPSHDNKDSADVEYSKLCESLQRKYGEKLNNTNGDIDLITSSVFEKAFAMIALYESLLDGVGDIRDYDEWKYTDLADYNVKIDLVCYYTGKSYSEASYYNRIGYKMYTDEEYQSEVQQKKDEMEEMDNDL